MRLSGKRRLALAAGASLALLVLGATLAASRVVGDEASGYLASPEDAPSARVATVPGAGVRPDGSLSAVLEDRLTVAADIYRAGKVRKVLVSGDHGRKRYDEPAAMAARLEELGVRRSDIFLDHAGFDTYATLYRARDVFGVREALVVTQDFHLPRTIFIARRLGIDATGVRADRRRYGLRAWYAVRERAARLKAVLAVAVGSKPRSLGAPISLEGDGSVTRDRSSP